MAFTITGSEQKMIVFKINEKEYSIPVEYITAIEKMLHITRVPNMPKYIKGVINLRGVIIPIIDLKERFNIGETQYNSNTRIIIVSFNDITIGMIVDEASDVLDIRTDDIEPSPIVAGSIPEEFIYGVVNLHKRLLILLNLETTIQPPMIKDVNNGY